MRTLSEPSLSFPKKKKTEEKKEELKEKKKREALPPLILPEKLALQLRTSARRRTFRFRSLIVLPATAPV
jgi:hypothetical protein